MKTNPHELLAPAGTAEAAWAALAYGADAVYLGLSNFSARAEAGNFTPGELSELIGYAHSLGRRVYVALNTLIRQDELREAVEMLALLRDLRADAVIVQDAGVARLCRRFFPELGLHASTQMAVHNLAGAKQLAETGFSRVVLARELGLADIRKITAECGIETEVFVHGALCYSYSGLCLFSSRLLGRSGNRGRCAYCCRQPFRSGRSRSLPFSMKDFSAAEQIGEIVAAGVASFKIEGRMKGPLYVAAVSDFYRRLLDGTLSRAEQQTLLADIQTIFGRPSTDLYLSSPETRPIDPVNDGHRGAQIGTVGAVLRDRSGAHWLRLHSNRALQKRDGLKVECAGSTHPFGFAADDMRLATDPEARRRFELPADTEILLSLPPDHPRLEPGAAVYCSFSQAVRQRYAFAAPRPGQFRVRRPVHVSLFQSPECIRLTASADCYGRTVSAEQTVPGPFEAARQPEKSVTALRRCFDKLGNTDWELGGLDSGEAAEAVFVPASVLNDVRRRLMDQLSAAWTAERDGQLAACCVEVAQDVPEALPAETRLRWSIKLRDIRWLEAFSDAELREVDEVVFELDPLAPDRSREQIEQLLGRIGADRLREALPAIVREQDVDALRELVACRPGLQKWEAANLGGLQLLKGKADVSADWPLYTSNVQAAQAWMEQGVHSFVLSPEDDVPAMSALLQTLGARAVVPVLQYTPLMISAARPELDPNGLDLCDRSGREFRVEQTGRQFVLVQTRPFSLGGQLEELAACGAQRFRVDFCYGLSSPEEAVRLWRAARSGGPVSA